MSTRATRAIVRPFFERALIATNTPPRVITIFTRAFFLVEDPTMYTRIGHCLQMTAITLKAVPWVLAGQAFALLLVKSPMFAVFLLQRAYITEVTSPWWFAFCASACIFTEKLGALFTSEWMYTIRVLAPAFSANRTNAAATWDTVTFAVFVIEFAFIHTLNLLEAALFVGTLCPAAIRPL